jgi:hypothetical protein
MKIFDIAVRVLALLVIPLLLWGVRLEVNMALLHDHQQAIQNDLDEFAVVSKNVHNLALALVRLEAKFDGVTEKVDEVRELLRARSVGSAR